MFFGFSILATALLLSAVAAYYSVAGLVAIFAAATVPVIIMGGSLELGKIVATVWLHRNWNRAGLMFKLYLVPAVAFLMLLTSMGIFGYLSKAHSDQGLTSGDVQAQISIYDEKIKTDRENIDANRKALKQLDEAVDQILGRSADERGAERAVQIRRSQQAERGRLLREIDASQKRITALNEERAPIAAEVRKIEAEVGPIKYIAALVYGDNPEANLLEKAVRWVIIMIVVVFDPLALTLILAANKQFEWTRRNRDEEFQNLLDKKRSVAQALDNQEELPPEDTTVVEVKDSLTHRPDTHPYLRKGFKYPASWMFEKPMVAAPHVPPIETKQAKVEEEDPEVDENHELEQDLNVREAMRKWKAENPNGSLKDQRRRLSRGEISQLPWLKTIETKFTYGLQFPVDALRGDTHVKTNVVPNKLFRFNGSSWYEVDKEVADSYTHDIAYIDYLISQIDSGQYDPELLSDSEREQIAERLNTHKKS
jgi:hypothetical protein